MEPELGSSEPADFEPGHSRCIHCGKVVRSEKNVVLLWPFLLQSLGAAEPSQYACLAQELLGRLAAAAAVHSAGQRLGTVCASGKRQLEARTCGPGDRSEPGDGCRGPTPGSVARRSGATVSGQAMDGKRLAG